MSPSTKTKLGVIFDVDGVLIDTRQISRDVESKVLAEYGVDLSALIDPAGEDHRGGSARDLLKIIKEQHGIEINEKDFIDKEVKEKVRLLKEGDYKTEAGLTNLLKELNEKDVSIAVATSGTRETTNTKLEVVGVRQNFKVIVAAEDVERHKPHPDAYLAAAKALGIEAKNCVVIEDTSTGMQAAREAGMKVIGFMKHGGNVANLGSADLLVDEWENLSYSAILNLFISQST